MVTGLAFVMSLGTARLAGANTITFEAESIRDRMRGTITSPMMIKDDPAASGGSYITVAAGTNSPSSAPASSSEGVVKYTFSIADTGSYRIWARVSAPNDGDDSFWLRMGTSGSWIRWNEIPLGTAYHWVLVKAEGASSPSTFNLTAGVDNELQIAYREDGTRLDALYITNDTAFNPNAPLTAPARAADHAGARDRQRREVQLERRPGRDQLHARAAERRLLVQPRDPVLRARRSLRHRRHRPHRPQVHHHAGR
jgi:hypothetical protein